MYLPIPRLHLVEINDEPWYVSLLAPLLPLPPPSSSHISPPIFNPWLTSHISLTSLLTSSFIHLLLRRFPAFLRHHVQTVLTHMWTIRLPIIQSASPATLVARVLRTRLGSKAALSEYTFVDFCAGAGGPTPAIERAVNERSKSRGGSSRSRGQMKKSRGGSMIERSIGGDDDDDDHHQCVDFVLTDLHPHLSAWQTAALQSPNILFVSAPVDASRAPPDLLSQAVRCHGRSNHSETNDDSQSSGRDDDKSQPQKQFRLFSLALHHFEDAEASRILRHALRTSSGFGVFELQARTFESMGIMAFFGPLMWVASWWWFWRQWEFLFWMYVVPVVPFVVVYDGVISSLRTRTPAELMRLIKGEEGGGRGRRRNKHAEEDQLNDEDADEDQDQDEDPIDWKKWNFQSGSETHTWPLGELNWFIAVKDTRSSP